jgi:multicomponent Na+:H+ antiporter subunit A
MTAATLIVLAPCSLLVGAVLQVLIARLCSARTKGILAVLTCLPAVIAVVGMLKYVQSGQAVELNLFGWDGPLALVLHVDALSVLFAFMGACLGGIVLLYSVGYMAHDKSASRFYFSMLVFIGGFIGLVYSANLLFFYLCWEVIGLCSFTLVGFWYTNREAVAGARKVLLMTHIAGYGLLTGILLIYYRTGSTLWTDPAVARSFTGGIFVLMLVALVAKSVQVPLHTWIPEAMAAPTPVSALLHAACYVKAGVYLVARMHSFGAWPFAWSATVVWVGTITMLVGVMYAMVQSDLKRMLAFHTVSQIGYMITGIGIGTPLGITAGLLHCLNHGFFKGGLFLSAGAVQHATGTRDMNQLGGLAQRMPRTTFAWLISVGSMMGIPLMSGFASKWMLYTAALQAGWAVPAVVAWVVSLGTVFSCIKATDAVFLGPVTEKTKDAHEVPPTMQWGLMLIATGSIVLGVAPQLAVHYFLNPILAVFGLGTDMQVTWFGLFGSAGSFSTTAGLVLALVSLVVGGVVYALAYVVSPAPATLGAAAAGAGGGIFTGGEPLVGEGRITAHDFSGKLEKYWRPFFRWSNVDRFYLGVWEGLLAVSRTIGAAVTWMEGKATILVVLLAAVALVGVRWLALGDTGAEAIASPRVPPLLALACAVAAGALILAALTQSAWRRLAPLMILAAAATVAGLALADPWQRLGLLELGALLTIPLVWQSARTRAAKLVYVAVVLISALSLVASALLMARGQADWARALLFTSVCVKLAAVPLFFWLLKLADELPGLVLGLIVAVVDMAALGELFVLAQVSPWTMTPQGLWLGVAAATALIASILMLSQRSLKRLLVLSTVEDVGFLLMGIVSAGTLGYSGALLAAATHALAKALLFVCLSAPEAAGELDGERSGLTSRYPISGFGFLFGMLAMLGVPPTMGFIGKWRLYETALQMNPLLLAAFALSSILALIAYALALTRTWWGAARDGDPPAREPLLLKGAILVLAVVLVGVGLWPDVLQMLQWGRP